MATLGFLLFVTGACGMDSAHRFVPAMMIAAGMALLFSAGRRLERGRA